MDGSRYWIWLSYCARSRQAKRLLDIFGTPYELFERSREPDESFEALRPELKARLKKCATEGYIDMILEDIQRLGARAVTPAQEEYPPLLKEIYDPPPALYVKGGELAHDKTLAIVGARRPTRYGMEIAASFSKELARQGICVVSGLALGIDSAAHLAALEADTDMPTMAALGCGVDIVYPKMNAYVYDKIAQRGALISEYPPGTLPSKGNFPERNRIISGLSLGVLVIEAGERSGTSITVGCALDQGREVLAVPGRVTDAMSFGTNAMLKSYAHVATCPADVLEALGLALTPEYDVPEAELDEAEAAIVDLLRSGARSTDELAECLDISIAVLNSSLTLLEFRGIIRQLPGRLFALPFK